MHQRTLLGLVILGFVMSCGECHNMKKKGTRMSASAAAEGGSSPSTSTVRAWPSVQFLETVLVKGKNHHQGNLFRSNSSTEMQMRGSVKEATRTSSSTMVSSLSRNRDSGQGRRHFAVVGSHERNYANVTAKKKDYGEINGGIGTVVKENIGNLFKGSIGSAVTKGIGHFVKGTVHKLKEFTAPSEDSSDKPVGEQDKRSTLILRKTVFRKISSRMVNKTSKSNSTALSHKTKIPFSVVPLEYPNLKEYTPYRPLREANKNSKKGGVILKDKYNRFQKGPSRVSTDDSVPVAIPFRVVHRKDPKEVSKLKEVMSKYPVGATELSTTSHSQFDVHEWIEAEENSLEGVSPSPSLPMFPKLTWPYQNTSISTTRAPPSPLPLPPPTGPAGDDKRSTGSYQWTRVPTVHVTPMSTYGYPVVGTHSSLTQPPSPPTETPPSKSPHHTNIWYKPTINYVGGQAPPKGEESSPHPVVLRVWNFVEESNNKGKKEPLGNPVQLVSEKEIPPWALQGLGNVVPDAILNLEGIPQAVRDLVEKAIRKEEEAGKAESTGEEDEGDDETERSERDGESRGKEAIQLNYVLWKKDKQTGSNSNPSKVSLDEYVHLLTTEKPSEKIVKSPGLAEESETWQLVRKLLTRLQESSEKKDDHKWKTVDSSKKEPPVEIDGGVNASLPSNVDRPSLLANLAALVVLARHLNGSFNAPPTASTAIPSTTLTSLTVPSPAAPQIPLNLTVHLLKELMIASNRNSISPPQTSAPTLTSALISSDSSSPISKLKSKTLLLQGAVKKGIKPIKKKAKRFKKKLKNFGWKLSKKKGQKKYWFDLVYDIDLHSLLKKKFLYFLALKYAPAFFVLAVGLVPLSFLVVPILLKILYFKKKPRYIRVPVPVPKPYPVPWEYYNEGWGHPQRYHHPDQEEEGNPEEHPPGIYPSPPYGAPQELAESSTGILRSSVMKNEVTPDGDSLKKVGVSPTEGPVGHAYELGFDLGSKLSKITNIHDKEVLKILIQNKKEKIERLLDNWKSLHEGKGMKMYRGKLSY